MIRTAIPELKKAIEDSTQAIVSFYDRPGLLECEEFVYAEMEMELRKEILIELVKAKKLMKKQPLWRRILNSIRK